MVEAAQEVLSVIPTDLGQLSDVWNTYDVIIFGKY